MPRIAPVAGLALFNVSLSDVPHLPQGIVKAYEDVSAQVIFALWPDERWEQRLADTPWTACRFTWLLGSSVAGLDMQDEEIKKNYADRLDAIGPRRPPKLPK